MKLIKIGLWFLLLTVGASAQTLGLKICEEGTPPTNCRTGIKEIHVSVGTLTIDGQKASITTGGGGGGGTGDVVGPASATDNAVARFNGTGGKTIQNSVVTIGDTGNVAGIANLDFSGILTGGSGPTTITDSAGKILSAALNTVQPAQGGTGITSLGTGVATALGVNTGTAGAVVLFNGAGGTPSSIALNNGTGLPLSTGVTGDLPFASFVQAPSAGFVGATASGDYSHRTPTQVTAALDAMVGDSGSGGTKGLVPAPASGDAAAGKFLKADGTWAAAGGGGGTPGGSDTQLQYNNAGSFGGISGATTNGTSVTLTSPTVNTGITLNAAPLTMSGNITAAAWTTGGIRIKGSAATLTDTTSSGTVAAAYTNALGGNTIAASSSTTFTNYYSTFLNAPTAGSNVTLTNAWALGLSGGQQVIRNSLGTTNATGIELVNNTAAAAGAQQISPDVIWTGQGWKTTATAASQTVNWKAYLLPVQGTANPNSVLAFTPQINGAGYSSNALLQLRTVDISAASSGSVVISALSPNTQALTITPKGLNSSGSIQTNTNNGVAIQEASTTGTSASIAQLSLIATTSATPAAGFGPSLVYASKTNGNSQRTIGYIANVFTDATDATRTSAYDFQLVNSGTLGIAARLAPGSLRMGDADAASPVAQTLSVQGGTGTNTSGVTWTHQASLGTSQGVPGRHSFTNGALIAASGTTTQTPVSRLELGATKVLANNTTTTIVNVTDASNTVAAGFVEYAVEVFDGTDLQVETGSFTYQVTNKGGTIANNTITFAGASGVGVTSNYPKNTTTSGTLAVTWAISAANPALLSVNANSSLTPSTGYPRVTYSIRNLTQQAIAVQ